MSEWEPKGGWGNITEKSPGVYKAALRMHDQLTAVWRVAKALGPHHPVGRRLLEIVDREEESDVRSEEE